MSDAENSISEPVGFKIFWGSISPSPYKFAPWARAKVASCVMKVCLAVTLCVNGFDWGGGGGGGVAIVHYWIWKVVRPPEKILATPLLTTLSRLHAVMVRTLRTFLSTVEPPLTDTSRKRIPPIRGNQTVLPSFSLLKRFLLTSRKPPPPPGTPTI